MPHQRLWVQPSSKSLECCISVIQAANPLLQHVRQALVGRDDLQVSLEDNQTMHPANLLRELSRRQLHFLPPTRPDIIAHRSMKTLQF